MEKEFYPQEIRDLPEVDVPFSILHFLLIPIWPLTSNLFTALLLRVDRYKKGNQSYHQTWVPFF